MDTRKIKGRRNLYRENITMWCYSLNERTLVVELGSKISAELSQRVSVLQREIAQSEIPGVLESWPTYGSVAVEYDPATISFEELEQRVTALLGSRAYSVVELQSASVTIPVTYDTEGTADMDQLCQDLGMSASEIAAVHSAGNYAVAMIGFLPGFPYLIGLPSALHHPRKPRPSLRIPSGAVAIGGAQTGIYPDAGPGGWYVIGHTPLNLFEPPDRFLLKPGDTVKFQPT